MNKMAHDKNAREELIKTEYNECFWNDYTYTPEEVVALVNSDNENFNKLFVSRILAGSSFPSRSLNIIYGREKTKAILPQITVSGRVKRRLELVEAVLFDKPVSGVPKWI